MNENQPASSKRTYRPPCLVVYGDVRDITQANNVAAGNPDGGGFPPFFIFKTRNPA